MDKLPFVLSCDTPADLTDDYCNERNIKYLPYHFSLGGENYTDDLGKTLPYKKFYEIVASGTDTKTAPPNTQQFVDYFTPFLEQGFNILHVCLSSGLTGVMTSANLAKEELEESFPGQKVLLVDSLAASRGFGLLIDKLADLRDEGMEIDELYDWANENKLTVHHWFYSTDLSHYVRGGRITKAEGWFGTMLNLCPLMNVDSTGHLIPRKKCRGRKAAANEAIKMMSDNAEGGLNYNQKCFISHASCLEDAQHLAKKVEETFPQLNGKVQIESIGPVIGSHTGPGTVALFFFGGERKD